MSDPSNEDMGRIVLMGGSMPDKPDKPDEVVRFARLLANTRAAQTGTLSWGLMTDAARAEMVGFVRKNRIHLVEDEDTTQIDHELIANDLETVAKLAGRLGYPDMATEIGALAAKYRKAPDVQAHNPDGQ